MNPKCTGVLLISAVAVVILAVLLSFDSDAEGGSCGESVVWQYDSGTLSITGTGDMYDYNNGESPWHSVSNDITNLTISDGIVHIGRFAFQDIKATNVEIPDSVKSVGINAFRGCDSICSLRLGSGLDYINKGEFNDSDVLETITVSPENRYLYAYSNIVYLALNHAPYIIPRGMVTVELPATALSSYFGKGESNIFFECTKLKSITVSPSNMELRAFNGVLFTKDLSSMLVVPRAKTGSFVLPDATRSASFVGSSISTLTLGSGMPDINGYLVLGNATYPNNSLKTLNIGKFVSNMENSSSYAMTNGRISMFAYCPALEKVTLTGNPVYHSDGKVIYNDDGDLMYVVPTAISINVPDGIRKVTAFAFRNCMTLETVILPDSLEVLENYSFNNCPVLTELQYGSGLNCTLRDIVFNGCISLSRLIGHDNTHYYTRTDGAVYRDDSEKTILSFVPPNTTSFIVTGDISSIDTYAFMNNRTIEHVELGTGLSGVEDSQFEGCISLREVIIPSNITSYGRSSFFKTALISADIGPQISSVGQSCFKDCSELSEVTFHNSETEIGSEAFSGCSSLISIILPSAIISIEPSTFKNCSSLITADIPDSVESIGNSAFEGCESLKEITYPESLSSIGVRAFGNCTSLIAINMNGLGLDIPDYAFINCGKNASSPITLSIPDGVGSIGEYAFSNGNISSLSMPSSVRAIGDNAFMNCPIGGNISLIGVEEIGHNAFMRTHVEGIQFSSNLIDLGNNAFSYCPNLTAVVISSPMEDMGFSTFNSCEKLESVDIECPNVSIGSYAFAYCKGLKTVRLSVAEIDNSAFSMDSHLTDVVIDKAVRIGQDVFSNCTSLKNVTLSSDMKRISDDCFIRCTSLLNFAVPSDNPYFSTDGRSLLYDGGTELAFYCSGNTSPSYSIPDSVKSLWDNAFFDASSLKKLFCGASLSSSEMKYENFKGCPLLSMIEISESNRSMTALDGVVYSKDRTILLYAPPAITECSIDTSTEVIKLRAFYKCTKLVSVRFPAYLTDVGDSAFYGCTSLTSINLQSVSTIGAKAFMNCSSLSRIVISETGNISYGDYCFYLERETVTIGSCFEEGFLDDYLGDTKASYVGLDVDTRSEVEKVRSNTPLIAGGILAASVALIVAEIIIRRRK